MNAPATGAVRTVAFLERHTAPHVFGLPGSSSVPVFHQLATSELTFVPSVQENAAVAMADGYARFAGPTSVLLYMLPGLATGLGNLYNAFRDESPLLLISSQVATDVRAGSRAVGEADTAALARTVTRWSHEVSDRAQLVEGLSTARRAVTGPPAGPALLVVPEDLWADVHDDDPRSMHVQPGLTTTAVDLRELSHQLTTSERPLIVAGGQVRRRGGAEALETLAAGLGIPVMYEPFWNDRLCIAPSHPSCLGQLSERSGLAASADVVLCIGARFFNEIQPRRDPWFSEASFVAHVNLDPDKVVDSRTADWKVAADPASILDGLVDECRRAAIDPGLLERRRARVTEAKARRGQRATAYDDVNVALHDELDRAYVVDESVTAGAFIVAGFTSARVDRYVSTTGGSLGWGTGAAAGVALGTGEPVTCLLGDGAFFFGLQGLIPAVAQHLPITYVVLDNGGFGSTQMYEQQYVDAAGGGAVHALGSDFRAGRPSIVAIAQAMGITASEVETGVRLRDELMKPRIGPRLLQVPVDRAV